MENLCDLSKCNGGCCAFLTAHFDEQFSEDRKRFMQLHGVEVREEVLYIKHQRVVRTHLKFPVQCGAFDKETGLCRIYDSRPEWCKKNPVKKSVFIERCTYLEAKYGRKQN